MDAAGGQARWHSPWLLPARRGSQRPGRGVVQLREPGGLRAVPHAVRQRPRVHRRRRHPRGVGLRRAVRADLHAPAAADGLSAGCTIRRWRLGRCREGDDGLMSEECGVDAVRLLLVGREVSAVCFVRDYVELHFDGPILRAFTEPFGMYGCTGWRFPGTSAAGGLLRYIGLTVDDVVLLPGRYAQLGFGEHSSPSP